VYPLLDKSLPLFKRTMKKWDADIIDKVIVDELSILDERQESGDVAEAVIAFLTRQAEDKQAKANKQARL
jgi:hypothetical protein